MQNENVIFISYRRSDSTSITNHIYEHLANHFGTRAIFRDTHSIKSGEKFPERLRKALQDCTVLISVIGKTWASATDLDGRQRLENPEDWVRREIETALDRNIWIIPLLVENATLPMEEELPGKLIALRNLQVERVRPDKDFKPDTARLIKRLDKLAGSCQEQDIPRLRGRLRLKGHHRQQLANALAIAFPNSTELERMLDAQLNIPLNTVTEQGPYPNMLFNLVREFNARGKVEELIEAALRSSPINPELQELAVIWQKKER